MRTVCYHCSALYIYMTVFTLRSTKVNWSILALNLKLCV